MTKKTRTINESLAQTNLYDVVILSFGEEDYQLHYFRNKIPNLLFRDTLLVHTDNGPKQGQIIGCATRDCFFEKDLRGMNRTISKVTKP